MQAAVVDAGSWCRFSAVEDVEDFPREHGRRLKTCLPEQRLLADEDRGVREILSF